MTPTGEPPRSRRFPVWLWVAAAAALLVLAAAGAAALLVTPERSRAFAEDVLSRSLSREVRFTSARLSLWPPLAVEVRGIAVADPRGFAQGTMLGARRVRLGLSLWALLGGELRLRGVVVESPRLRLWRDERGRGNWEGLAEPPAGARPGGWDPRLVLRDLRIEDGAVALYRADGRAEWAAEGLRLSLDARRAEWQWSLRVRALRTFGPRPAAYGPLGVEGALRPGEGDAPAGYRFVAETPQLIAEGRGSFAPRSLALEQGRLHPKAGSVTVEDLSAQVAFDSLAVRIEKLAGRVGRSPFEIRATLAERSLSGQARAHLDLADVARLAPAAVGSASGRVQLAVRFRGPAADPDSLDVEGTATLSEVAWQPPDENAPPLAALNGRLWADGSSATVSGLTGRLGPVPFRISARIDRLLALRHAMDPAAAEGAQVAELRFDLATGPIDAARLFPPGKPMQMAPAVVAEGTVRAERLIAGRLDARDVVARVRYDRGVTSIDAASAEAYGGHVSGSGRFDASDMRQPSYDLDLQAQGLRAGQLLEAWTPFPDLLQGQLDVRLGVTGAGMRIQDALPGLTLDGLARAVDGRLAGAPLLAEAARFAGLPELRSLDFRDLLWRFQVERGRMQLADTWIRTGRGDFSVGGQIGLDGALGLAVSAVLPGDRLASLPPQVRTAAGFFQDSEGRVLLDFGIAGTLKSPRFAWRTDRAAARLAERLESELSGRAAPYQRALEDTLARTRAAVESRLEAETSRAQKELTETVEREQQRLEERARGWLGGLLGPSAADTAAGAPLALPGADSTGAAHPQAGRDSAAGTP